LRPRLAE